MHSLALGKAAFSVQQRSSQNSFELPAHLVISMLNLGVALCQLSVQLSDL